MLSAMNHGVCTHALAHPTLRLKHVIVVIKFITVYVRRGGELFSERGPKNPEEVLHYSPTNRYMYIYQLHTFDLIIYRYKMD
jgi:hypothetical protein